MLGTRHEWALGWRLCASFSELVSAVGNGSVPGGRGHRFDRVGPEGCLLLALERRL